MQTVATMVGKIELSESDFFTEFGKRVFRSIAEIAKNGAFDTALLGEFFSPEEQGRIMRYQLARRDLSENGVSVLQESIAALKRETAQGTGDDPLGDLMTIIQNKRNT